jgi:beta-galactosidase
MLKRFLVAAFCFWSLLISGALAKSVDVSVRTTLSLDGQWQIQDSSDDRVPNEFFHQVQVPGLVHASTPHFIDVDKYQTNQLLSALVSQGRFSKFEYEKLGNIRGTTVQTRKYFWYRKTFEGPARSAVAILKVNKAQFGTVVYLNGARIGEHFSGFTAGIFDVSKAIRWNESNVLVIRIGAHPGMLPATVSQGTDFEKNRWTPGIYDSVNLVTTNNPVISAVQAAPRIATADHPEASVLVQTELRNYSGQLITTNVSQQVFEWKTGRAVSDTQRFAVVLAAGETKLVKQIVPVPHAHLWSPDDPFLYRVNTSTDGDSTQTRFGMREFRFDTVTQRAYLNGRPYFLRGSNIALHRFFEDPESGQLPWNDAWVHRLLVDIPKRLHWNAFRFSIGPVPDRWLEIADENGLLIQNEYAVWVGSPSWTEWRSSYDATQMTSEYSEWMRDGWNHPSVVIWDASNESWLPELAKVIPAIRGLDLSNRPWENSYNVPDGPDDPVEDHHYFMEALSGGFDATGGGKPFALVDLEDIDGVSANPFTKSSHAKILNEYGWMWINREGSPTLLTQKLYPKLLGDKNTTANRRVFYAQTLGGETELWRAYRHYAGVMQFAYLTNSDPQGFTSDQFIDLKNLTLEPHFEKAMEQAFKPLGVYLNFWHPALDVNDSRYYTIHMVNDEDRPRVGKLRLAFANDRGLPSPSQEVRFSLSALGSQAFVISLRAPSEPGSYKLQAVATADDNLKDPTISVRDVVLQPINQKK